MNTPNNWVVLKFTGGEEHYRVLAGWNGAYLYGSHWRLNSGITKVEEDGDYYLFHGHSGSIYHCHKDSYGMRMNIAGVYKAIKEHHGDNVEVMPSTTDWLGLVSEK